MGVRNSIAPPRARIATAAALTGLALVGVAALPAAHAASPQGSRAAAAQSVRVAALIASGDDPETFGVPTPEQDPSAPLLAPTAHAADLTAQAAGAKAEAAAIRTTTPIKHVVVIIGENHTFDNIYATYKAPRGQSIKDLLSEGIVTADGGFGRHVGLARQQQASDTGTYRISPHQTGTYATLPQPNTTHAQGLPQNVPDTGFPANLPNGPYQITKYVPYSAYVGDPLHRFYQMAQQIGPNNDSLFTWVHQTAGDDNGANPPAAIHQGALEMGYYNMQRGDAPVLKSLAEHYALADNYHQAVQGGTGANHLLIGAGQDAFYQNASGEPTTPPTNEIENPTRSPAPTTTTSRTATREGRTRSARTPLSRASGRSSPACAPYTARAGAPPARTTCSTTTTPATTPTAPSTPHSSRSRRSTGRRSATS